MNRRNVALLVCLCTAAYYFQTVFGTIKIFGVNIEILKKPIQCYKNPDYIEGDMTEIRLHYDQNRGICMTVTYMAGTSLIGLRNTSMTFLECLEKCKGLGEPTDI